jgi:hypothetical protein
VYFNLMWVRSKRPPAVRLPAFLDGLKGRGDFLDRDADVVSASIWASAKLPGTKQLQGDRGYFALWHG